MGKAVRIAVTGAAGNIGYSLLFRIASGQLFGPERRVILQLLEIPPAMKALEGVAMELDDCSFPSLAGMVLSDEPGKAFDGAKWILLVGARPRGKGMERKDLLQANGPIFTGQGRAINETADDDVRVLVVGNPANTNCLIASTSAPDVPPERFAAMTMLDHNRARRQLAAKCGVAIEEVSRMTIWGNHSSTQYPDAWHARVGARPAPEAVGDDDWIRDTFIPGVQKRGAAIIEARGQSSAASAASAAIDSLRIWHQGTRGDDWTSMAIPSTGAYDTPRGVIFSYPVTASGGEISVVEDLKLSDFDREKLAATSAELLEERAAVEGLLTPSTA